MTRRAILVALLLAVVAAPVYAGTYVSNGWRGNPPITITLVNVSVTDPYLVQGISQAAAAWSESSVIDVVIGGKGKNKVSLYEGAYGPNQCMACTSFQSHGGVYTSSASIIFNASLMGDLDGIGEPGSMKRAIVCHEVGHALGLGHVEDGTLTCMAPGPTSEYPSAQDYLNLELLYER